MVGIRTMIETAAEREKRRTREPELEWEMQFNHLIWNSACGKYAIEILHSLYFTKYLKGPGGFLSVWKCVSDNDGLTTLDQAKLAAHEHWRENGYE